MFTAEEARAVANSSKEPNRFVKRILREIKREARKGKYSLRIYCGRRDSTFLEQVCGKLKEYGYGTLEDFWLGYIYVSWKKTIID